MSRDVATTFDRWAETGEDAAMEEEHGDVFRQVLAEMAIRPGEKVLDLGCGNGWSTRLLARAAAGAQAVGVDLSPGMIARAEELHSFTIRARYELASFEELEFEDASFDRAFSMEALYYARDLDRALSEIHRVLKPGGTLDAVVDYYEGRPGTSGWPAAAGLPIHLLGEGEWRAALERAGFQEPAGRRVVDRRGPGDEAAFEPDAWVPRLRHAGRVPRGR